MQPERCHLIFNEATALDADVLILFNVKGGVLLSLFSGSSAYKHVLSGSHDSGTFVFSKHPLTKLMWQPYELSSAPLLSGYTTNTDLGALHVQVHLPSGATSALSAAAWCPSLPTPLHKDHTPLARAHRAVQCVDTIMQVATVQAQLGPTVPHMLLGPLHSPQGGAAATALSKGLGMAAPASAVWRRSSFLTKHLSSVQPPCSWLPPSTAGLQQSPWPEGPLSPLSGSAWPPLTLLASAQAKSSVPAERCFDSVFRLAPIGGMDPPLDPLPASINVATAQALGGACKGQGDPAWNQALRVLLAPQLPAALQKWVQGGSSSAPPGGSSSGTPSAVCTQMPWSLDQKKQGAGLWGSITGAQSSSSPEAQADPGRTCFVAASHSPGWKVQLPACVGAGEVASPLVAASDTAAVQQQVASSRQAAINAVKRVPVEVREALASTLRDGVGVVERHQQEQMLVMSLFALATLTLGRQVRSMRTAQEVGLPASMPQATAGLGGAGGAASSRRAPSHIPRAASSATPRRGKIPFAFKALDKNGSRVTVVGPWTRRGGHVAVAALACGMVGCGLEWLRLQTHDRALMLRTVQVLEKGGGQR